MDINRSRLTIVSLFMITIFFWCLPLSIYATFRGITVKAKTCSGVFKEIQLYSGYHALVIGIGDYRKGWPRLPNPVKDAKEVATMLKNFGWTVDVLADPDGATLRSKLNRLVTGPGKKKEKAILLWYSGHGQTIEEADGTKLGYLVPVDAPDPDKDLFGFMERAVSMRQIETVSKQIMSKHVLMLFDSCFSGAIFQMVRAKPSPYIQEKVSYPVRQFITAGTENEQVPDKSVFKDVFVQGLKDGFADLNRDNYITGQEIGSYLQERVVNYSRKAQHPQYGKINNPKLDKGDFVFLLASSGAVIEESVPEPSQAYVSVESNVSGAKVLVDGSFIGTTNLSGIKISPGEHRVRVEKEGYEPYFKRVRFKSGRSMSLTVVLDKKTPSKSKLYVDTNPKDARVRILNIVPKFYQGIVLDAGRYHVEVSAGEYETKKLWVTLVSGEDKSIDVRLKKRAVSPSSSYSSFSNAREIKRDGRFVAYANGTIKDTKTGLMWASKDNGDGINWKDAKRYCENYRGGGYTDWRLPTQDELSELYEPGTKNTNPSTGGCSGGYHINKLFHITCCCPWASETRGSDAAFFHFSYGSRYWRGQSSYNDYRALPVRSGK